MKHIHFIGICGVAMSALAIAFYKRGYHITGSDKGFYPPVSTNLKETGITFYPGWHVDKMCQPPKGMLTDNQNSQKEYHPDVVVVGNVAGSTNPEWAYVQKHHIPHYSYPEILAKFLIKPNSIVCAGTYGKTTTSTLMTWILMHAGFNPNYMIGGIPKNDIQPAALSDSNWSIVEGDEYKSARWDTRPKFAHYSPTHLLLTAVIWDHADLYPTEKNYIDTFKTLLTDKNIKTLVISKQAQKVLGTTDGISYGSQDADYLYHDISMDTTGVRFSISHHDDTWRISSQTLGRHMVDNITACFAMAHQIGIDPLTTIEAISSFQHIKRRLEKRPSPSYAVFDDIAHSPEKVKSILATLREIYAGNIVAVFEPNTGNRKSQAIDGYTNAFLGAKTVIIPRLSSVKKSKDPKEHTMDGQELRDIIARTHADVRYIDDDDEVVVTIKKEMRQKDDVVVFLGSHGFRGMIDEVCAD